MTIPRDCKAVLVQNLTIDNHDTTMQLVRLIRSNNGEIIAVGSVEPFSIETPSTIVVRHMTIKNNTITSLS